MWLIVAACCLGLSMPASGADYSWDFRKGRFDNRSLVPLGPGAVNLLRPTTEGLRIGVPAGHNVKTVGFSPRFKISGDFHVKIEFTLLNRTRPKAGYGSGPTIYVSMGSTQDAAASLGRQLRPDGRDVYGVFAARIEEGQRIPTAKLFDIPDAPSSTSGRLELKRVGEELTYSVADTSLGSSRPLATLPVSAADVTLIRVGVTQSDPQSAVAMVLHRIDIVATDLPHLPSEQARTSQLYRPRYQPPIVAKSYRWLWQSLAGVLMTIGLAIWLWRRPRFP